MQHLTPANRAATPFSPTYATFAAASAPTDITVRLDTYGLGGFGQNAGAEADAIAVPSSRQKHSGISLILSVDTQHATQRVRIDLDTSGGDGVITSMRFID